MLHKQHSKKLSYCFHFSDAVPGPFCKKSKLLLPHKLTSQRGKITSAWLVYKNKRSRSCVYIIHTPNVSSIPHKTEPSPLCPCSVKIGPLHTPYIGAVLFRLEQGETKERQEYHAEKSENKKCEITSCYFGDCNSLIVFALKG